MAIIKQVYENSPFYDKVFPGDKLIKIDGNIINDFLDYMSYTSNMLLDEDNVPVTKDVEINILRNNTQLSFTGEVKEGDLRIEFDTYLMDDQRSCKNKCIFCFIDQLPAGMRKTVYYKDDDFRLSLLYGNYVTLTNIDDAEADRIVSLRVSPLNISVHTTNPELRVKMMKNPSAANILKLLTRFAEAKINMRAQIVLCKGINDGDELSRTMNDLKSLYPAISSVSIVPVGLTKHRQGLYPLLPFEKEDAKAVVEQVNAFGEQCLKDIGTRLMYLGDEFFLKADVPLPGYAYYEEFEQIENGVGMLISFAQEFNDNLQTMPINEAEINISIATGVLAKPFFENIVKGLKRRLPNLNCEVYEIKNDFFGEQITVAGLLTGQDIAAQLKDKPLGDFLLISSVMLRGRKFLDDMSVEKLSKELNTRIKIAGSNPEDFIRAILRCVDDKNRKKDNNK